MDSETGEKVLTCIFKSNHSIHDGITLPCGTAVTVGREKETNIADGQCSRKQLELIANYRDKYVLVKHTGANPSQIEGIDIKINSSAKLREGEVLYVVNMKFPHQVVFVTNKNTNAKETEDEKCNMMSDISFLNSSSCQTETLNANAAVKRIVKERSNDQPESKRMKPKSQPWKMGLKSAMQDNSNVIREDGLAVVIKDKYPKAKYHWLVLPKESISNPRCLDKSHITLLKHMLKIGRSVCENEAPKAQFRFGYHAVPSMGHLHMHVISQDLSSPCLKTKKHYNSFTTDYFVEAEEIMEELQTEGKVKDRKSFSSLLNTDIKCHLCGKSQKNMPTLKRHLDQCYK